MEQITAAEIQPIDEATLATVLECALDLQVPVTLFYAVLDRLARPAPWYPQPAAAGERADQGEPGGLAQCSPVSHCNGPAPSVDGGSGRSAGPALHPAGSGARWRVKDRPPRADPSQGTSSTFRAPGKVARGLAGLDTAA